LSENELLLKHFDLVVLGEVAVDVVLAGVAEVPKNWATLGTTKTGGIFTAGSAGYVAHCFSRLGGRAAIVGRIGEDDVGRMLVEGFRTGNVSTRYLMQDKRVRTELSTVLVYNNGNKASIVTKIPPLNPQSLDLTFLGRTRALHAGGYLLIPSLWGRNIRRILRQASFEDAVTSLDPQMSATGRWSEAFSGVYEKLHIILLDEEEALRISQKKSVINAIEYLHRNGVQTVAVKAGHRGCVVSGGGKLYSVKGLKSRIVSTIGAGDAFDAAFIYGVLRKWPLLKVAEFSNLVASVSTTQLGCATAIPRAKDLEKHLPAYYGKHY